MIEGRLWEFKIAEPSNAIAAYLFPGLALQADLLDVELYHLANRIARSDLTIDPGYS